MSEKKGCANKLLTTLMIICTLLSVGILVIISYDKFYKKKEEPVSNEVSNNVKKDANVTLGDILSAIPLKRDNDWNISSYDLSTLTTADVNYAIANYILHNSKFDDQDRVMLEKSKVEEVFKHFLKVDSFDINVKNQGIYSLEQVNENGKEYYKIVYPSVNTEYASIGLSNISQLQYNGDELVLICTVTKNNAGEPGYITHVGDATITFDLSDGISLKKFDYEKYDTDVSYSLVLGN